MTHLAHQSQLNFYCDSAGISSYHVGDKPDYRSVAVAEKFGIDISSQRAREFSLNDFNEFDTIFAMDRHVFSELKKRNHNYQSLFLMREFDPEGDNLDVPDPYYGQLDDFIKVYQIIERSCQYFLDSLNREDHRK